MSIPEYIYERLDGFVQNNTISEPFIYNFGPFICMTEGFEEYVDKLAKLSPNLKLMQWGAYFIRSLAKPQTYREIKVFARDFIIEVEKEFPASEDGRSNAYADSLNALVRVNLDRLNEQKKLRGDMESVITSIAPIVPYQETINRSNESVFETYKSNRQKLYELLNEKQERAIIDLLDCKLIGKGFDTILRRYEDTIMTTDAMKGLHDQIIDMLSLHWGDTADADKADYYLLAATNFFYKYNPEIVLESYLQFYDKLLSREKMNFEGFESFIKDTISHNIIVDPDASLEAWNDPEMDTKEEEAIRSLIGDIGTIPEEEERREQISYNLNLFYNYMALHREIRFDNWSKRYFETSFSDLSSNFKIVNINHLANNMTVYELSNKHLYVPYTDTIDWEVKYMVLSPDSDHIEILQTIE